MQIYKTASLSLHAHLSLSPQMVALIVSYLKDLLEEAKMEVMNSFFFPLTFKPKLKALLLLLLLQLVGSVSAVGREGSWQLLSNNTGVVAMHMTLTHRNTVVLFDQTQAGRSNYLLRRRRCLSTRSSNPKALIKDDSCWAHSIEYDISLNSFRPLELETDTWASSGAFLSNGVLLQTGGHGHGSRRIRHFQSCSGGDHHRRSNSNSRCGWRESRVLLSKNRWFASNQILPHKDRTIVVGGKGVFSYEFVPKSNSSRDRGSFDLPFLHHTNDNNEGGNNLYPFLHLSSDGNLFIFANRDSILFNYRRNKVIKTFPRMPGNGSRNYPSSGSSVLLPLEHKNRFSKLEVMVCGGAPSVAYRAARQGHYVEALRSCGRMVITGHKHKWVMEEMPGPRLLSDMLILPTGHILIINGATRGCAGWHNATSSALEPYLYSPKKRLGRRFTVLQSTKIPRMYHSSAVLLPDGRVLVAGGNPNERYTFRDVAFPTELRLQAFVPYYMDHSFHHRRPTNVSVTYAHDRDGARYGEDIRVRFRIPGKTDGHMKFSVYAPPFTTHAFSMNQRMLRLWCKRMVRGKDGWVTAVVEAPPSPNVAPSGYYLLTVINGHIPSLSEWVRFIQAE